ncbi:MAG: hypothetical protein APR62_00675 [Smithella sp. SDB]|nr:MAG: hypothetical protein APR62_00675 [Smithella sp. SDB]
MKSRDVLKYMEIAEKQAQDKKKMPAKKTYAFKYLELAEKHAEKIAARWVKDIRSNARTPTYKNLNENQIVSQCIEFYQNFSKMFVYEKITDDVVNYFRKYALECYSMNVPAKEAIYALILMRRHIWLYAEFQMIFSAGIARHEALDTLNRTILIFDYAVFEVTWEYQNLIKKDAAKL